MDRLFNSSIGSTGGKVYLRQGLNSGRVRLAGLYNADLVIGEDVVRTRNLQFGHVARYAIRRGLRTGIRFPFG